MKRIHLLVIATITAALLAGQNRTPEAALGAALHQEEVQRDLNGAIAAYKKLLTTKGLNHKVAAEALYHLGLCYQKVGDAEARKAFERLVAEYGDQAQWVAQARAKLAAMGNSAAPGRQTTERIPFAEDVLIPSPVANDRPLIAFTDWDTGDLLTRDLATGESHNLTRNPPGKDIPGWPQDPKLSADGELVIFGMTFDRDKNIKELRSMNTDGSGMRVLLSRTDSGPLSTLFPAAISPDKKTAIIKVGLEKAEVFSLADNTAKPFADGLRVGEVNFSPDSRQIVFSAAKGGSGGTANYDLFVANGDGRDVRPLLADPGNDTSPYWTPDGKWIVFLSDRNGRSAIWATSAEGGTPRLLKEDQGISDILGLTRDGALYYSTFISENDIHAVQLNPGTPTLKGEPNLFINTFMGRNKALTFSPDGKWLAWVSDREAAPLAPDPQGHPQMKSSLVIRPAAGGEEKVMTLPPNIRSVPDWIWLPGGKELLIRYSVNGQAIFEKLEVPGGRTTELYRGAPLNFSGFGITGDGKALLGLRCRGTGTAPKPCDLVRYDLQTKSESVETLNDLQATRASLISSPDGKWLAITAPGRLFVKPMSGGKPMELARSTDTVEIGGGIDWTPDSRQIIYSVVTPSKRMWLHGEFRMISVEGGVPKVLPVKGRYPSIDPAWRLAFSVDSTRRDCWVARNLLPAK